MLEPLLTYLFVGCLCGGLAGLAISKRSSPTLTGGILIAACTMFGAYQLFRAEKLYTAAAQAGSEYALGGTLVLGTALGMILVSLVTRIQKLEQQVHQLQHSGDEAPDEDT